MKKIVIVTVIALLSITNYAYAKGHGHSHKGDDMSWSDPSTGSEDDLVDSQGNDRALSVKDDSDISSGRGKFNSDFGGDVPHSRGRGQSSSGETYQFSDGEEN